MDELPKLPEKPGTSRIAFRLDKRLKRQIDIIARRENTTRTAVLTTAIKEHIARNKTASVPAVTASPSFFG